MTTDLDWYPLDLRGYLVLREAVDRDHIARMNGVLDAMPAEELLGRLTPRRRKIVLPTGPWPREPQVVA